MTLDSTDPTDRTRTARDTGRDRGALPITGGPRVASGRARPSLSRGPGLIPVASAARLDAPLLKGQPAGLWAGHEPSTIRKGPPLDPEASGRHRRPHLGRADP